MSNKIFTVKQKKDLPGMTLLQHLKYKMDLHTVPLQILTVPLRARPGTYYFRHFTDRQAPAPRAKRLCPGSEPKTQSKT